MAKKVKPFATEADLCAKFLTGIGTAWTPYAETAGWDILLVRGVDGFQIGIQAKLKLNAQVIAQTLEDGHWPRAVGPDCRAVLIPYGEGSHFGRICAYIGITIIGVYGNEERGSHCIFDPMLPELGETPYSSNTHNWIETPHERRHKLPDYVPDVAAGDTAPVQLTEWKIAALKIMAVLERRGFVTRADFKHNRIDHRRWLAAGEGWLKVGDGGYVEGPYMPGIKRQHPRVYAEILADADKWIAPPSPSLF